MTSHGIDEPLWATKGERRTPVQGCEFTRVDEFVDRLFDARSQARGHRIIVAHDVSTGADASHGLTEIEADRFVRVVAVYVYGTERRVGGLGPELTRCLAQNLAPVPDLSDNLGGRLIGIDRTTILTIFVP